MPSFKVVSHSSEETRELGVRLGELAQPGDIYLLSGELGAGKTCLTQGIAWGLGSTEYAQSPTFVLVREMKGRLPLYHIDLYRLDGIAEISNLGLDDYLYGNGLTVIEWGEKGLSILPGRNLTVKIEYLSDNERRFEFVSHGKHYEEFLVHLRPLLKKG